MQYLKKEVNDEVLFHNADKHRSLLQVDIIILDVCNQACPKYPKFFFLSLHILVICPEKHGG